MIIPDVIESDEGQYYCVVTNEWGRSVRSDVFTLTVKGTHASMHICLLEIVCCENFHGFHELASTAAAPCQGFVKCLQKVLSAHYKPYNNYINLKK